MADKLGGLDTTGPNNRTGLLRALVALLLVVGLLGAIPSTAGTNQDAYAYPLPAPVVGMANSEDGRHVVVVDDEARFTFLLDGGELERSWSAPARGLLSLIHPILGEEAPTPVGVTMTPDGAYWAGAVSHDGNFGGRVYGFADWSDEPIWTYELPDGGMDNDAVQPTSIASGGKYHAVGTTQGKVHVLLAGGQDGTDKKAHRTYKQSNTGVPFGPINDVAVSRDGGLFLIGTQTNDEPSLHLYTDVFFKSTFKRITQPVSQVALSPDGTRGAAVTGSGDNTRVHFLDTTKGATIWERTVGSNVNSLALSKDGSLLAVAMANGRVQLYEEQGTIMDSEPRRVFTFDSAVRSVTAADDGNAAAAATDNGRVHMLDLRRSKPLWTHEVPSPAVSVSLSADQSNLIVGSVSGNEGRVTYLDAVHDIDHLVPPQPRLLPGITQTIPVELANNGNRMTTVWVDWKTIPNQWEGHESNLTLGPGETGTLGVGISLPPGQPEGDFELAFDLIAGPVTLPVEFTARVPQVTSGQSVKLWAFEYAVPGGAPAAFLMKLQNTGNTLNELALGYSGLPSGWSAEFTGPQETKLRPGEDRQVALTVRAPHDASIGDEAWFTMVIAWQHGEERHDLRVQVVDHDTYTYELQSITGNGTLPDEDGMDALLERLQREAANPVTLKGDSSGSSVLIPFGGAAVPIGAVAVALVLLLVRRRE